MPYLPSDDDGEQHHGFAVPSADMALVHDYSGLDMFELECMDVVDYLILRRDAVVHALEATEEGRKKLYEAWVLTQTEPDMDGLHDIVSRR